MTITFEDEYGRDWPFSPEELAVQVAEACLDYENCPYEAQVNILLTGNEEIRQMNRQFRNIDRETDVLSFPMGEYPAPGDFSAIEEDADSFDPETGELLLGDIVLSGDRILSQAQEYGHSVRREFAFLIAHSMLHLMGYDHIEPEEAETMESRQRKILDLLDIKR
ncbi:MAG TPA: rRNA maturation RNase YbeY [Candidatus Limivivens intestinipullorum]|uniref:Endoribonuclease YbeY n=1 Tax=Candidatus Limivivens intestinipullorum TaxID=2840858 RepID=A0A9D1EVE4_9FIRM|nr:rRNA maturation RNase YbeY [Candidatus Limivivens intestinipullorum]